MQIIYHMTMDMSRHLPVAPVDAVQGDGNTRKILLTLLEDGKTWNVPEGVTAAVAFRKADGKKGLYDALPDGKQAVTFEGNTVTAILAPQVLTCPGDTCAAVVFHDSNLSQLATFPFAIRVKGNPAAGKTVSNDYYRYATMEEVSAAVEAALASIEEEKQEFLAKAEEALRVVHDTATEDAPAIVCEASGESVTVTDAAQRPMRGLSLYGKTIQNGTPTPETPVPLESVGASGSIGVSVAGKNLFNDVSWFKSCGFTKQSDGSWLCRSLHAVCWTNLTKYSGVLYIALTAKTDATNQPVYIFVDYTDGSRDSACVLQKTNGFETLTYETSHGKTVSSVTWSYGTAGEYYVKSVTISIVNWEYEPYKEVKNLTASTLGGLPGIPVSSGGNYMDSDGQQWICDYKDYARGVYVQRVATAENLIFSDNGTTVGTSNLFRAAISNANFSVWKPTLLCSHLPGKNAVYNTDIEGCFVTGGYLYARIPGITNADSFNAKMQGAKVVYEMVAPIETALSAGEMAAYAALHTNKPNTTVFNDSGAGIKLAYVADTKTYIDNKITAISAAMLNA